MQRSDGTHLLPAEALPLAHAFLRGHSIQTEQGEVISGYDVSYGKTYIEAFPEYIHDKKGHKSKVDGIIGILQELGLKPLPGSEVVVVGCGQGTHDEFLVRDYGLHVSGVDISEEALALAREKAAHAGLSIQYYYADATLDLPFVAGSKSAVFCIGTSWGMDPQDQRNQATFAYIYTILQSEGVFVLDYVNGQKWRKLEGERYKETTELASGIIRIVEGEYYPDQTAQITRVTLKRPDQPPQFYYEYVKYYTLEKVLTMLEAVGFRIQKIFGDVEGHPFDPLISHQMVIVATRQ